MTGMARRTRRVHHCHQCVGITVDKQPLQLLHVAARGALVPQLLPGARPEPGRARLQRQPQRLDIHPSHHQDLATTLLLHHTRNQPSTIELKRQVVKRDDLNNLICIRASHDPNPFLYRANLPSQAPVRLDNEQPWGWSDRSVASSAGAVLQTTTILAAHSPTLPRGLSEQQAHPPSPRST